jgi:hypothetical protein
VNEKEIEFIIDLTSTFMKFITKKWRQSNWQTKKNGW